MAGPGVIGCAALFALLAAALHVLLEKGGGAARRSAKQPPPHLSGPIDATAPTAGASVPSELLGLLKSAPPAFPPSPALPAGADLGRHCDFERFAASDLDAATFVRRIVGGNRPVLIEGLAEGWPAMEWGSADEGPAQEPAPLGTRVARVFVRALQWALVRKARHQTPQVSACLERSLALDLNREPGLAALRALLLRGFGVPNVFADDMLSDPAACEYNSTYAHRWLLAGAAGSGSCFHVDPFNTSAWNTVISGSKRWALYPPSQPLPLPGMRGGGSAQPPSDAGWFFDARRTSDAVWGLTSRFHWGGFAERGALGMRRYFAEVLPRLPPAQRPLQCMARKGDTVFLPAGWWHAVLNVEDALAVTQNFATARSGGAQVEQELALRPGGSAPRKCLAELLLRR